MNLLDHIPQQIKTTADVGSGTIGWIYLFKYVPHTWGDWAALLAGLWSLVQITDYVIKKIRSHYGTKGKKKS